MIITVDPVYWPPFEAWDPEDGEPVRPLDSLSDDDAEEICSEILGVVGLDGLPNDRQWSELSPGDLVRACQDFVEYFSRREVDTHG